MFNNDEIWNDDAFVSSTVVSDVTNDFPSTTSHRPKLTTSRRDEILDEVNKDSNKWIHDSLHTNPEEELQNSLIKAGLEKQNEVFDLLMLYEKNDSIDQNPKTNQKSNTCGFTDVLYDTSANMKKLTFEHDSTVPSFSDAIQASSSITTPTNNTSNNSSSTYTTKTESKKSIMTDASNHVLNLLNRVSGEGMNIDSKGAGIAYMFKTTTSSSTSNSTNTAMIGKDASDVGVTSSRTTNDTSTTNLFSIAANSSDKDSTAPIGSLINPGIKEEGGQPNTTTTLEKSRQQLQPKLNYKEFLRSMKNPTCAALVKEIKEFIVSFISSLPINKSDERGFIVHAKTLHKFINIILIDFSSNLVWKEAFEKHRNEIYECLEKFITHKIYSHVFHCQIEEDRALYFKINALKKFIKMHHLDIPVTDDEYKEAWARAIAELRSMNDYKAPRDKMICILNACRVITNIISATQKDDKVPGADEFLPALIWTVIQANTPNMLSNLEYIARYRAQEKLMSENGYFFMSINGATSFIQHISASALTITAEEFNTGMVMSYGSNIEMIYVASSTEFDHLPSSDTNAEDDSIVLKSFLPYINDILKLKKPLQLTPPLAKESPFEKVQWQVLRNRLTNIEYEQLNMLDITHVLHEYKNLAMTCETLLKEREERAECLTNLSKQAKESEELSSKESFETALVMDFFM